MSYQKFFNPEEAFSRSEIEAYQLERLKATVKHCMDSPFYKERFRQAGLTPSDIQTLDDLKKIPFTTKQDLRETYPFGMAAVPLDQCVRLHSSSGTTGNPTVILHTQKDLEEWANAFAGEERDGVGEGINIAYLYSFLLNGKGVLIFRTDNTEKAAEVIASNGLSVIEEKDLSRLL